MQKFKEPKAGQSGLNSYCVTHISSANCKQNWGANHEY